jgi:hypothetical protein
VNYKQLQRRVERLERLVEGRGLQTQGHWAELKKHWREGWTPARIIAAGLVSGFISGRAEPLRALSGPRLLQMIGAVSGLFASVQASFAAEQAEEAADTAEDAVTGQAAPTMRTAESDDEIAPIQPRPAEAATELSHP